LRRAVLITIRQVGAIRQEEWGDQLACYCTQAALRCIKAVAAEALQCTDRDALAALGRRCNEDTSTPSG
jgi:hypothetical protein